MIKIELQFSTIAEATAFLMREPVLGSTEAPLTLADAKADAEGKPRPSRAPKPETAKAPASPPAAAVSSQPATDAASSASSTEATPSAGATGADVIDYAVLQKAVFTLAGKSREAAAGVAASFGVKTFKELDAARWAEALDAVNAAIEVA